MPDLEALIRSARPDWPGPSAAAEARARAALGFGPAPRSPRGWLTRTARSRGTRLLIPVALLLTAGAAVAATLISSGSAGASAGRPASLDFGRVATVGTPVSVIEGSPSVAVDARGNVTLVWGRAGRVVVSTRPRGGAWSPPVPLSRAAGRATSPRVAAEGSGAVTVTWRERTAGTRVSEPFTLPDGTPAGRLSDVTGRRWAVVARTRPAGGAWGPATPVSPEVRTVRDLEEPGLAAVAGGGAVATWDQGGTMWSARRSRGGWSAPVRVGTAGGEAVDPQLTGGPDGGALLVWSNRVGAGLDRRYEIRASVLGPGGVWSSPRTVSASSTNPPYASGAANAAGQAVVTWRDGGDPTTSSQARGAIRARDGRWSVETPIGTPTESVFGERMSGAVASTGVALVLDGATGRLFRTAPGDAWRPVPLDGRGGRMFGGALTLDGSGAAVVARAVLTTHATLVQRVGGERATARLDGIGNAPVIAVGDDGTTAVSWVGSSNRVVASVAEPQP